MTDHAENSKRASLSAGYHPAKRIIEIHKCAWPPERYQVSTFDLS